MKTIEEIKEFKDLTPDELTEIIDSIGDEYEEYVTFSIERLSEDYVSKSGKVIEKGSIWHVTGYELAENFETDNTEYCVIYNSRYVAVVSGQMFDTSDRFLAFTGNKEEAQLVAKKFGGEVYEFEKVVVKSHTKMSKNGGEIEIGSELIIK